MRQKLPVLIAQYQRQLRDKNSIKIAATLLISVAVLLLTNLGFIGSVWADEPKKANESAQELLPTPIPTESQVIANIQVLPTSMNLPPKEKSGEALVTFRNLTTDATISDIKLSSFTDADVNVEVESEPSSLQNLPPGGELAWILKLSNKEEDPTSGNVYLRVDYTSQKKEGNSHVVPQVASAFFQVSSREIVPGTDVKQLVDVKVETTLLNLDQQHPGKVYIIITNNSNRSFWLKRVQADAPDFIKFDEKFKKLDKTEFERVYEPPGLSFSLHQTEIIPIDVEAAKRVQPGKHLLAFTIEFGWDKAESVMTRKIVTTKEVNVGILGESTILQLLAVPTFLVVPGFLVVVTWGLLWKVGFKSKKDTGEFPLKFSKEPTDPEFWVVAITISILVISGYMLYYRDFLKTYGLEDIVIIWLFSVFMLGVGGYIFIVYGRIVYIRWHTPSEADKPIDILKKLHRQGLGVFVDCVNVRINQESRRAFVLEKKRHDRDTTWVGPPIRLKWKQEATDAFTEFKDKVKKQLEKDGPDNPGLLAKLLKQGVHSGYLEPQGIMDWIPTPPNSNDIQGVREVKTADMEPKGKSAVVEEV